MEKIILTIDGMHCDGCARRIENSLKTLENIQQLNVSYEDKKAIIVCNKELADTIKNRIDDLGFQVVGESYEENNIKN